MTTVDDILDKWAVPDPDKYIDRRDGLQVATLADDVLAQGPLAEGLNDRIWSYHDGVWSEDQHVVRNRCADLLGQKYRKNHAANTEDVVRARGRTITCEPIAEIINFTNGLYNLKSRELQPHSPDVLSTVQMSIAWDPDATCPEFDKFLAAVLPADMISLAWELIGYLMYSGNPLHRAVMLTGGGRNGKGTFLRVITALLGAANVSAVTLNNIVSARFATAELFGKIANIAGDIDGTYLESTAMLKTITGQDAISAEHKGRDPFTFTAWAVPVFSANKIPGSADVTSGYLSRWLVINFPHSFAGREDRDLEDRLITRDELSGIAAKAIPALENLLDRGDFETPESAIAAKEEFERRVDQVRTWLNECTEPVIDEIGINRTTLYEDYKAWTRRDGYKPVRAAEFYERLEGAGYAPKKVDGDRRFVGLKVTDHASDHQGWPA